MKKLLVLMFMTVGFVIPGVANASPCPNGQPDNPAPPTPQQLTVRATAGTQVFLTWKSGGGDIACNDANGNMVQDTVYYLLLRDGISTAISTPQLHALDSGLAPGTSHHYAVVAYDQASNASGQSNPATTTTRVDFQPTTVVAGVVMGQKNGVRQGPLFGEYVSTGNQTAMTNMDGWYNLVLNSGTFPIQFGPGCGFYSACASGYPISTDSVSTSGQYDVLIHDKLLMTP